MAGAVLLIKWGHAGDKKKFVLEKSESVIWLSDCRYLFRMCRWLHPPQTAGGLSRKLCRILRQRLLHVRSFKQFGSLIYSSLIIHLMTGWMIPICRERSLFRSQSPPESEGNLHILCVVIITAHSRVAPRTHNLLSGVTLHSPQL